MNLLLPKIVYITFWETRPLRIIRIPNLDESGFVADPQIVLGIRMINMLHLMLIGKRMK